MAQWIEETVKCRTNNEICRTLASRANTNRRYGALEVHCGKSTPHVGSSQIKMTLFLFIAKCLSYGHIVRRNFHTFPHLRVPARSEKGYMECIGKFTSDWNSPPVVSSMKVATRRRVKLNIISVIINNTRCSTGISRFSYKHAAI